MSTTKNRFGCFGVFIGMILCLSLLFNAAFLFSFLFGEISAGALGGGEEPKFQEEIISKGAKNVSTKIAVIRLTGLISGYVSGSVGSSMVDDFKIQLKQAVADKEVNAIVLAIDSPGGEVTASDILYTAVKKAREVKPVVVSMGSLAASGGYYVAIAGSYIFAHETTFTGSIGVIMQTYNYEGLMDKVGVHTVTYKSGAFKDMMSGARAATPAEKEYIDGMVQQTYSRFVGLVAKERKLPEDQLRNGIADGRVISGKDALTQKLVDGVGDFEDAVAKAIELGKAQPGSAVIGYSSGSGLGRYLRMLGSTEVPKKVEINVGPAKAWSLQPGYFYLLPANMAE